MINRVCHNCQNLKVYNVSDMSPENLFDKKSFERNVSLDYQQNREVLKLENNGHAQKTENPSKTFTFEQEYLKLKGTPELNLSDIVDCQLDPSYIKLIMEKDKKRLPPKSKVLTNYEEDGGDFKRQTADETPERNLPGRDKSLNKSDCFELEKDFVKERGTKHSFQGVSESAGKRYACANCSHCDDSSSYSSKNDTFQREIKYKLAEIRAKKYEVKTSYKETYETSNTHARCYNNRGEVEEISAYDPHIFQKHRPWQYLISSQQSSGPYPPVTALPKQFHPFTHVSKGNSPDRNIRTDIRKKGSSTTLTDSCNIYNRCHNQLDKRLDSINNCPQNSLHPSNGSSPLKDRRRALGSQWIKRSPTTLTDSSNIYNRCHNQLDKRLHRHRALDESSNDLSDETINYEFGDSRTSRNSHPQRKVEGYPSLNSRIYGTPTASFADKTADFNNYETETLSPLSSSDDQTSVIYHQKKWSVEHGNNRYYIQSLAPCSTGNRTDDVQQHRRPLWPVHYDNANYVRSLMSPNVAGKAF